MDSVDVGLNNKGDEWASMLEYYDGRRDVEEGKARWKRTFRLRTDVLVFFSSAEWHAVGRLETVGIAAFRVEARV